MKRTNSIGSTTWTVSRSSNLTAAPKGISNQTFPSGTISENGPITIKEDNELTLYPGMVVCEKIQFKPSNNTTVTVENAYV